MSTPNALSTNSQQRDYGTGVIFVKDCSSTSLFGTTPLYLDLPNCLHNILHMAGRTLCCQNTTLNVTIQLEYLSQPQAPWQSILVKNLRNKVADNLVWKSWSFVCAKKTLFYWLQVIQDKVNTGEVCLSFSSFDETLSSWVNGKVWIQHFLSNGRIGSIVQDKLSRAICISGQLPN